MNNFTQPFNPLNIMNLMMGYHFLKIERERKEKEEEQKQKLKNKSKIELEKTTEYV